jgi:hypothetical protein
MVRLAKAYDVIILTTQNGGQSRNSFEAKKNRFSRYYGHTAFGLNIFLMIKANFPDGLLV